MIYYLAYWLITVIMVQVFSSKRTIMVEYWGKILQGDGFQRCRCSRPRRWNVRRCSRSGTMFLQVQRNLETDWQVIWQSINLLRAKAINNKVLLTCYYYAPYWITDMAIALLASVSVKGVSNGRPTGWTNRIWVTALMFKVWFKKKRSQLMLNQAKYQHHQVRKNRYSKDQLCSIFPLCG